jgi:hypothetical protein
MNREPTRTPRLPVFTPPREQAPFTKDGLGKLIDQIKRNARRMVKEHDGGSEVSHCQALETLSKQNGFKSYAALLAAHKVVS